ncbi:beta strand repeat-containing protein, partial [Nitrospirillum pindoramense]
MALGRMGRDQGAAKTRRVLLLGASALAIGMGLAAPRSAQAYCGSFSTSHTIGSGASCTAFTWTGSMGGTVVNNGTLLANIDDGPDNTFIDYPGFSVAGGKTLTALINNRLITGVGSGIVLTGNATSTTTSGTVTYGISAYTTIGTIVNNGSGRIGSDSLSAIKIINGVKIGGITNAGTMLSYGNTAFNLLGGSIGTLTNSGNISSTTGGAVDVNVITTISTIGTLINSGLLQGNARGTGALNVFGVVGSVSNSGTILNDSGPGVEVRNYGGFGPTAIYHSHVGQDGTLSTLTNSGLISGTVGVSIGAGGSIVSLVNAKTGTIQGGIVIAKTTGNPSVTHNGSLGALFNAGVIIGNVVNNSSTPLSITGGSGTTIGTFTGTSGKGSIISTLGNIVLTGGNLLFNDNINVGTGTLVSQGTSLTITGGSTIAGSYSQGAGTLALLNGGLVVTDAASITGGTVIASLSSTGNYVPGQASSTLLQGGAGSSYSGVSLRAGTGGLGLTSGVIGNALVAFSANDYIGGTLGGVVNSQTIAGIDTALYVASSGSLGSVSNTGLLNGTNSGVANYGTIGLVTNGATGTIAGGVNALYNDTNGVIGTLANSGTITANSVG